MNSSRRYFGYLEAGLSGVIDIILFAFKIWIGVSIGSIAIIADGWHSLSDTLTSSLVFISFFISGKPKDKNHPFGHGRAELIGGVIMATLLGIVGLNFLKESILALYTAKTLAYTSSAFIIMIVTVIVKELLAQFSFWAGKKIDSKTLIIDGWHHRSDAISSLILIIGFYFNNLFWAVDAVLGIIVSLFILYTAISLLKQTSNTLLGTNMNMERKNSIKDIIKNVNSKCSFHHVHEHIYGEHVEVTFHLTFPKDYTLSQSHDISTVIEEEIRNKLAIEATIHLEPEI